MQNKPNPTNSSSHGEPTTYDQQSANKLYMQYVQMQQYYQSPQNWNMNQQTSDAFSGQDHFSMDHNTLSPIEKNNYFADQEQGNSYEAGFLAARNENRSSDENKKTIVSEDAWSTRPRARNHIRQIDLNNLPAMSTNDKKQKSGLASGIEINIRNVEDLLEDEEDNIGGSGFASKNLNVPQKKVRSVENSVFNSGFDNQKSNSGWSDTYGSKLNKTKITRDSESNQLYGSFGESKQTQDLATIFETKGGPFFAWEDQQPVSKKEETYEGFKVIPEKSVTSTKKNSSDFRTQQLSNGNKYSSNFYAEPGQISLQPIISLGSEGIASHSDKQKSNSEI